MSGRAAAYLRVSSDSQRHSLQGQFASLSAFAAAEDLEIVQRYEDRGRSGLRLKGREALQQLLADVLKTTRDFDVILVQDVSRWGRFQDSDEAAHYEFVCRQAGVQIRYCEEPFERDAPHGAGVFKAVKRIMAAEFSRELSAKTRRAQFRWAEAGFKMGGVAGYGLRRAILSAEGAIEAVLEKGQQKLLQGQRVVYVLGPPHEVATVRRIFDLYLTRRMKQCAIADLLNAEGSFGEAGRPWATWTIGQVLGNPKYAGEYRFGRRRRTLDGRRIDVSREHQLAIAGALPAIIERATFDAAARRRQKTMLFLSTEEILVRARRLRLHVDHLSPRLIAEAADLPSPKTLFLRFGPINRLRARLGDYPDNAPFILPGCIDVGRRRPDNTGPTANLMTEDKLDTYTAFHGDRLVASGALPSVAVAVKQLEGAPGPMPIVFKDRTGDVVELDLRGSEADVHARLSLPDTAPAPVPRPGRGRPRLGVTAREVTLLPQHWEWLASQPGGASAAIRRLVAEAQKGSGQADALRAAQTAAYKVMYALAGHLPGYEDALRALFAGKSSEFEAAIAGWPQPVAEHVRGIARRCFDPR